MAKQREAEPIRGVFERPKGSNVWWINYYVNGKQHREKAGNRSAAIDLYRARKADSFSGHIVPFADISGCRLAASRGVRGVYFYPRGKSRVFVRESSLRLDDFYKRWRASIYDLDMAERLKRKAAGKERLMDWFFVNDREQHPAIGGPDRVA
jgi:hypothetical protein